MAADPKLQELARRAEAFYADRLKVTLEATHHGEYVAIDPDTGDYFLGKTLLEAGRAARAAHPDRWCYGIRIGHAAVYHLGSVAC